MSSTRGVNTRHIVSFTKKADKTPETRTMAANKARGRWVLDHPGADHGKKSGQAEIRHDDHHAEQQNQRFMVDGSNRLVHRQHTKRDHEAGSDDGRTRAVYAKPRQPPNGEYEVGPKKN
jgi:hypothetical protein